MPQTLEGVEEEGECEENLDAGLGCHGPRSNCCNHRLCLKVPSGVGSDEVCDAENVEGASQGKTRDTVERRRDPVDLGPVDGKVGRDGTLDTLLCEKLGGLGLRGVFGRCESTCPGYYSSGGGRAADTSFVVVLPQL